MDFSGRVFLASIEEDNTQRALFRVRPLLDAQGAVSQEDLDSIGDEGFMRVVPDKQEQYTFKERMRSLGAMCLIDLSRADADSHKVRPNKNYAPPRGEVNRYVIYSDVIQPVGDLAVCEVVADPRLSTPVTSCYYLRSGGHIQGPYDKSNGQPVDALSCIAPDSDRLFAVSMPDERERLFFWPAQLPLGLETMHNTGGSVQPTEALPPEQEPEVAPIAAESYRAVPLPRIGSRRAAQGRNAGTLHEVVDRAVRQKRSESRRGERGQAADPLAQLHRWLSHLWQDEEGRQRATELILAQDGAGELFGLPLPNEQVPLIQTAMQQQLQDYEAERLSLMMALDKLRSDRALLLQQTAAAQEGELEALVQRRDELTQRLEQLALQVSELEQQRNTQLEALGETPPQPQQDSTLDFASRLVAEALGKLGFDCQRDEAMNLLLHCLLFPVVKMSAPYLADAALAARGFIDVIGAQASLVIAPAYEGALQGQTQLLLGSLARPQFDQEEQHLMQPWPVLPLLPAAGFEMDGQAQGIVIKPAQLREEALAAQRDIPQAASELLSQIDAQLTRMNQPLPLAYRRQMLQFLRPAQSLMDGGIAAALDFTVCCWVLPFMRMHKLDVAQLKPLLEGLPRTQACL